MSNKQDYQVPSNPADRSVIKKAILEASDSMIREQAEKELRKESAKAIQEKFGMPISMFNKLTRAHYKDDIESKAADIEAMTDNYSLLFGNTTNP